MYVANYEKKKQKYSSKYTSIIEYDDIIQMIGMQSEAFPNPGSKKFFLHRKYYRISEKLIYRHTT